MNERIDKEDQRREKSSKSNEKIDFKSLEGHLYERKTLLERIRSNFESENICIIKGESGVGKSTLARQYAEKCVNVYRYKKVYMMMVSDEVVEESIRTFANGLRINLSRFDDFGMYMTLVS